MAIPTQFSVTRAAKCPIANPLLPQDSPTQIGAENASIVGAASNIGALGMGEINAPSDIAALDVVVIDAPSDITPEGAVSVDSPELVTAKAKEDIGAPTSVSAESKQGVDAPSSVSAKPSASIDAPSNVTPESKQTVDSPTDIMAQDKAAINEPVFGMRDRIQWDFNNSLNGWTANNATLTAGATTATAVMTGADFQLIKDDLSSGPRDEYLLLIQIRCTTASVTTSVRAFTRNNSHGYSNDYSVIKSGVELDQGVYVNVYLNLGEIEDYYENGFSELRIDPYEGSLETFEIARIWLGKYDPEIDAKDPRAIGIPSSLTSQSKATVDAPSSITSEAVATIDTPSNVSAKPAASIDNPSNVTPENSQAINAPSNVAAKSKASTPAPSNIAPESASAVDTPDNVTAKPVVDIDGPSNIAPENVTDIDSPSNVSPESSATVDAPTIITSNAGTLTSPPFPLNHARILYNNILFNYTNVTASEGTGFSNVATPDTAERWDFDFDGGAAIVVTLGQQYETDTVCIAAHNLDGLTVTPFYSSAETGSYTIFAPAKVATNKPLMWHVDTAVDVRRLQINISGEIGPRYIGYISAGVALQMQRPFFNGHQPFVDGDVTEYYSNRTESGNRIGRIIRRKGFQTSFSWQNIDDGWYRQYIPEFKEYAKVVPFFVAWNLLEYPDDIAFGETTADIKAEMQNGFNTMRSGLSFDLVGL